jgi:hypothetical protein
MPTWQDRRLPVFDSLQFRGKHTECLLGFDTGMCLLNILCSYGYLPERPVRYRASSACISRHDFYKSIKSNP